MLVHIREHPCLGTRRPISYCFVGIVGVCGLLAAGYHLHKTLGGKPRLVSGFCCDRWKVSSSWVTHVTVLSRFWASDKDLRRTVTWGIQWGQLDDVWGHLVYI